MGRFFALLLRIFAGAWRLVRFAFASAWRIVQSAIALALVLGFIVVVDIAYGPFVTGVALGGIFVLGGLFLLSCWLAGQNDMFFTIVKEGTGKIILQGGAFHHAVMSFKNHHLNDPRATTFDSNQAEWQVLPDALTADGKKINYDHRPWFMKFLGLHWLGIVPGVFVVFRYRFQWNELEIATSGGERLLKRDTKDEPGPGTTDFFYVSDFTYAFLLESAETDGNFQVDVISLVTIALENAYKPFFRGEDWLLRTGAAVNGVGRRYVALRNFDQVRKDDPLDKTDFAQSVLDLNDHLEGENTAIPGPHGLMGRYGAHIKAVDIQDIALSGDVGNQVRDALQKKAVAEINRDATIIESVGESTKIRNLGAAKADALKSRLEVLTNAGSMGALLAQLDAMEAPGAGEKIIWANNPFVRQVGGLADLLQEAGITPAELAELVRKFKEQTQGAAA